MKETKMIKIENNIFSKIKNFFKKIFFRQKEEIQEDIEIKNEAILENTKDNFKENLIIEEDKEKIRLLNLQEEFSKGNITEEDMSEEDIEELHKLYKEQIAALEKSTEEYKQEIIKIRKNM